MVGCSLLQLQLRENRPLQKSFGEMIIFAIIARIVHHGLGGITYSEH